MNDLEKENAKLKADLEKAKSTITWLLVPAANLEKKVRVYGREKARRFLVDSQGA